MATATRKHSIVNPARRRAKARRNKRNKPRRHLSKAQIRAGFGGKRRKSAMRANRKRKRSVANPRRHATRSVPRHHARKRNAARKSHHRTRRRTVKRGNPAEQILSLTVGNPGGKRRSGMAKRRRKNTVHHHRKHRRNPSHRRRHVMHARRRRLGARRNPGGAGMMQLLTSGVFAAGGLVLSRFATQAVLGASNTGFMGYAGNAVATAALAWATHMVSKNPRNRDAVILGGVMGIIARLITDYTPYGSFLQAQGFGDYGMGLYLPQNDPMPSRIVAPNGAIVEVPQGWGGGFVQAPAAAGMGALYSGDGGGGLYA